MRVSTPGFDGSEPAEKTRVFLQYDPARSYDLAEVARQVKLYEIGDQLQALPQPKGNKGGNTAPEPMKPEDEQKLKALEQQLVQMFRNYKPGLTTYGNNTFMKVWIAQ